MILGAIGCFTQRNHAPIDPAKTAAVSTAALPDSPAEIDPEPPAAGATFVSENASPDVTAVTDSAESASVAGKVTDTEGNPIAGAQISVFAPYPLRDRMVLLHVPDPRRILRVNRTPLLSRGLQCVDVLRPIMKRRRIEICSIWPYQRSDL